MAITSAQLDDLLKDWQQKLSAVSQNLYDLDAMPTYQRLMGSSGMPQARLTGQTQQVVSVAMSDLNRLFQSFDLLRQTIDQACEMRDRLPRFGKTEDKIAEIIMFLSAESIELPVDSSPLAQRDLSMPAIPFQKVTPIALLSTMSKLFQSAAAVVLQVDAAWNQLEAQLIALYDRTNPVEAQIHQVSQQYPGALPEGLQRQLETVRSQLKAAQQLVDSDPLAAQQSLMVDIEAPLNAIVQQIDDLAKIRDQVTQHLQQAQTDFQRLRSLNAESLAKFTELREKVLNPPALEAPLSQETLTELQNWLDRLQNTFNLGNFLPVKVGLSKWQLQLDSAIAYEQSTLTANQIPLNLRTELRGRLTVLKAKATALGIAEDAKLTSIEQQVKQMLYSRPTDLNVSSAGLKTYEQALNAAIKS
jgi:hypothetical protein